MPRKKIIDYQQMIETQLAEKRQALAQATRGARDLEAEIAILEDLLKKGEALRQSATPDPSAGA